MGDIKQAREPEKPREPKEHPNPAKVVPAAVDQVPTIGRIVIYRTDARNGLSYDLPAIITCTRSTHPGNYPDGKKNPLPKPSSDMHVHLTVFSPGGFGTEIRNADGGKFNPAKTQRGDKAYKGADAIIPGSGSYVELDVPCFDPGSQGMLLSSEEIAEGAPPRSWRWPRMVLPRGASVPK